MSVRMKDVTRILSHIEHGDLDAAELRRWCVALTFASSMSNRSPRLD
jgi:hypothetical protein